MIHFWIPKITWVEFPELTLPNSNISGYYKIIGHKDDGRSRVICDWQSNLILDAGLERWGVGNIVGYCHVGSSNTDPSIYDTSLVAHIASGTWGPNNNGYIGNVTYGAKSTEPYYGWTRMSFHISPPGIDRILREIGFGWSSSHANSLWSRSLTKDFTGNIADISWLSDEYLEVLYEIRVYPFLTDSAYEVAIDGITRTGIIRAANVVYSNFWMPYVNCAQSIHRAYPITYESEYPEIGTGTLGSIISTPTWTSHYSSRSSTNDGSIWLAKNSYSPGSRKQTGKVRYGPDVANYTGGINTVLHKNTVGCYQFSINPAIMKAVDWSWSQNFETPTWNRYS